MHVFITRLTDDSAHAMLKVYSPLRLSRLTYSGPNKSVYELFDSLQYFIGRDMRYLQNVPATSEESFKDYYNIVTDQYKSRVAFLDDYCTRHNVQECFKKLALAEINSLWKSNLVVPTFEDKNKGNISTKFPDYYFKAVEEKPFTDEGLYFKTALYAYAAYDYWEYIATKRDSINLKISSDVFAKICELINNNCPDKMKAHFQGFVLKWFAEKGFGNYDSLLQQYSITCKDKDLVAEVNAVAQKGKERRRKIDEITLEKAEASIIEDQQGKTCTIKDLLSKKKFTVIDCWASWCSPCLREIPYTRAIEQQYEKDFNFVFLSFDKNKNDWTTKMKELKNISNSYLLVGGFKSDLAYHFGIASIPHYLIFDNNGNAVNKDASRPSKPQFKAILDDLLKGSKSTARISRQPSPGAYAKNRKSLKNIIYNWGTLR